jgi:hypothetical protein
MILLSGEEKKDRRKISSKKWRDKNKEYQEKYKEKNFDKLSKYQKEYQTLNKEELNKKRIVRKKNRYRVDLSYRLKTNIRNIIKKSFIRNGFSKKSKTLDILGCSFEEFKSYLESKFENWMGWENRGLYNGDLYHGWDIDHIIPLSSAKTEEEIIILNHYTNLQPLCSKINRDIKRDKMDYEID